MKLLDVNILVHAHREGSEEHEVIQEWLKDALGESPGVALTDLALSGCLRMITHPKIFKEPTPLAEALEFVEDFRSRNEVQVLAPGPSHWSIFMELCSKTGARGNAIPDAHHAAVAIELGCEWITLDRGFARFPWLRWGHPLD